jgi:stage V sporulation protein SpoVS
MQGSRHGHERVGVQAIGTGANNQAVKPLVLASGYIEEEGINNCFRAELVDEKMDDKVCTAIK